METPTSAHPVEPTGRRRRPHRWHSGRWHPSIAILAFLCLVPTGCDLETNAATDPRPKSVEETLRDLEEREQRVREREVELAEQSEELEARKASLQQREQGLAGSESDVAARESQLGSQIETLQGQVRQLEQRETELATELQEADARARELQARQARLNELERQLRERESRVIEREDKATQRQKQLDASTAQLLQREQKVQASEATLARQRAEIEDREAELEEQRQALARQQAEAEEIQRRPVRPSPQPTYPTIPRRDDPRRQAPPPISGDAYLPAGTELEVEFLQSLSSARQERGDTFRTRVFEDVYLREQLVVPAGSEVLGLVHSVTSLRDRDGRACLELRFTHLVPSGGVSVPIHAEWLEKSSDRSGRDAATIGAATLGGAILGRILDRGGDGGTIVGAILGAATGAVVTGNRGEEATLEQGAVVRLRLEEAVRLAR